MAPGAGAFGGIMSGAKRGSWLAATPSRWLRRAAIGVVIVAVTVLLAARLYYPRLLYLAPGRDAHAPGEGKLLTTRARDGVTVHATELLDRTDAPAVVYFHGNGVVMGDVLWMARELRRRGLGVVLCEYRGYGLSAGSAPSEAGLYEDAEAVLAALADKGIGPESRSSKPGACTTTKSAPTPASAT